LDRVRDLEKRLKVSEAEKETQRISYTQQIQDTLRAIHKPAKDDCVLLAFKKNKLGFAGETFALAHGAALSYEKIRTAHDSVVACLMPFASGEIMHNFFEIVKGHGGFEWWSDIIKHNGNLEQSYAAADALCLSLCALRTGIINRIISVLFGGTDFKVSTCIEKWWKWLVAMFDCVLSPETGVTNRRIIALNTKLNLPNTRITDIVDSSAFRLFKPSSLKCQHITWSEYYHCNCCKWIISLSPCGYIRYVSKAFPGSFPIIRNLFILQYTAVTSIIIITIH
jgi:hypothetical protein